MRCRYRGHAETRRSDYLAKEIVAIDDGKRFELVCDNSGGKGLPLVAWRLKDGSRFDEFAIAHVLRESGWVVPAYTMAPKASSIKLLRIVIRDDVRHGRTRCADRSQFSRDRARGFLTDLKDALKRLDQMPKAVIEHQAQQREAKKSNQQGSEHVPSHSFRDVVQHALQRDGKTNVRERAPWSALISAGDLLEPIACASID